MLSHASGDLAAASNVIQASLEFAQGYTTFCNDISLTKMSSDKKYKETKMKEIISTVCGLLNTDGGDLVINIKESPVQDKMQYCIKMIEQRVQDIVGCTVTVSNTNFETSDQKIILHVKKSSLLITMNYNLYLPTHTQVILVQPTEPIERVKEILSNKECVLKEVKMGSHTTKFVKDQNCGLEENEMVQLKNMKASASKCTTFSDRITSKGNKLPCYVSAFATHRGGHFYCGIKDDGIVEGEFVTDKDLDEMTKKVGKTINKMLWPKHFGNSVMPQKGKHWDIFIEPVLDIDSMVIPSTYVIVIYVASCPGAVFVEEPESYEIVDGKVVKMEFSAWKMKLCHPTLQGISSRKWQIPPTVQRCSWSSPQNKKLYESVSELLIIEINNGNWDEFSRKSKILEQRFSESAIKMSVLSMRVTAFYRRGRFREAVEVLQQYTSSLRLPTCQDTLIFEVIGIFLEAALERGQGNYKKAYEILTDALWKLTQIPSGLITASLFLLAATVRGILDSQLVSEPTGKVTSFQNGKREVLCMNACAHLQNVPTNSSKITRADMEKKAHINLAMLSLGGSRSGDLINKPVDKECLDKASTNLKAVSQSVYDEFVLSRFREIQFNSAMSMFYYRRSQLEHVELYDKPKHLLQMSFDYSKKAENSAKEYQFQEMIRYSEKIMSYSTTELDRKFKQHGSTTIDELLM